MQSFFAAVQAQPDWRTATWAVLGKGPSFARRRQLLEPAWLTMGLNHVCLCEPVTVTHVTDIDVLEGLGTRLEDQGGLLVMPFYPHVASSPGTGSLEKWCLVMPLLRRLDEAGRLVTYRSSRSATRPHPASLGPVVRVRYFSAVAAVNLLAAAGVKQLRTVGVDGGTHYAPEFSRLRLRPLTNGRASFDEEFHELSRSQRRHALDLQVLGGVATP